MANKSLGTRQKMMFRGASGNRGAAGVPGMPGGRAASRYAGGRTRAPAPVGRPPSGGAVGGTASDSSGGVGGGAVDDHTGIEQRRTKTGRT
ncbi:Uncharacterised protein [Pandoraea pulmonicola]|uniref:Uncharacterized protein n=1 Tax=Pandoraea pulmonicola TaxID=93221 RepID=A0AAJ5D0L1_PANPU|nr:Uncharacterised protein [Pandoraea pulmonicola]